jgi:hypothetical protein
VTYQTDQLQSIINELDRTLRHTGRWPLWKLFTRLSQQRQMLERVRNFLVLHAQHPTPEPRTTRAPSNPSTASTTAPIHPRPLPPPHLHPQAIKLELTALTTQRDAISAQRDALREEVNFLVQRKAQYLSDLSLSTPSVNLQAQSPISSQVATPQHLEQLNALHDRTDFLLSSMDSSLQLAFTSMQKNVEVYQTTLHQGLDRMHNLGYQSEVLFSALVNQLAQQLGRELADHPVPFTDSPQITSTVSPETPSQDLTRSPAISSSDPILSSPILSSPVPESQSFNRDITLENIFDNSSSDVPQTILSQDLEALFKTPDRTPVRTPESSAESSSPFPDDITEDITLEEMNRLFADIPSLRS